MKDELLNIMKTIKTGGLYRCLKFKYPSLLVQITEFQLLHHIDTFIETIHWIINDISEPPKCQKLTDNCLGVLKFQTMEKGFTKYCAKCYCHSPEWKNSIIKTTMERYGVSNPNQSKIVRDKKIQNSMLKYGVESPNQLQSVKDKKRKTLEKNYGPDGLANPIIKERRILNSLQKIGLEHHTKLKSVQDTKRETCMTLYGEDQWMKTQPAKNLFRTIWYNSHPTFKDYVAQFSDSLGFELNSEYNHSHGIISLKCKKCGDVIEVIWNNFQQNRHTCRRCFPLNTSLPELDISDYLKQYDQNIKLHDRSIISPLELDIVLESKKIAIEYCGLWCHSSSDVYDGRFIKTEDYHLNKLQRCNELGYKLITIFEDEWLLHKDIVKSRLRSIINSNDLIKLYARSCTVKEISYDVKRKFLSENHIQGDSVSNINLGMFNGNDIVSIMTFSKPSISKGGTTSDLSVFELSRFCNKLGYHCIGGASKLLSHFKKNYDWKTIFSYCDRRWSSGNLYLQLGFELNKECAPNYWYWGKNIRGRSHRFNYRKSELKNMLNYKEEFTEKQIMSLEGYSWIYDCGNLKFVMKK